MAENSVTTVEVDIDVANDVPPSIRYSELTVEELDAAIEKEMELCKTLTSWDDAVKASGLRI